MTNDDHVAQLTAYEEDFEASGHKKRGPSMVAETSLRAPGIRKRKI